MTGDYTELTYQDRIAAQRGMIRNFEAQLCESIEMLAINRAVNRKFKTDNITGVRADAVQQELGKLNNKIYEIRIGLPTMRARLARLIAEAPPEPETDETAPGDEGDIDTDAAEASAAIVDDVADVGEPAAGLEEFPAAAVAAVDDVAAIDQAPTSIAGRAGRGRARELVEV